MDHTPDRYYVLFMTTKLASLDQARAQAQSQLAAHVARSKQLHEQGTLLMAGAFLDHPEEPVRTMGVFSSREAAQDYARHDPFVEAGLVRDWTIREWANMLR